MGEGVPVSEERTGPFDMLDSSADMIATWTGMKAQWVAAGWSNGIAEQMTKIVFQSFWDQHGKGKEEKT